mmetsp:Transcript_22199/g.46085  ORF Transcript_22199/g.46085 Transcript_22199/m.46085 type:complete len:85 (-) Transcript_22199:88-342(-)
MIYTGLSRLALAGGFSKTEAATPHMKQQKGRIQRVLTLHVHHHYKQTGMLASLTFRLCIQQSLDERQRFEQTSVVVSRIIPWRK